MRWIARVAAAVLLLSLGAPAPAAADAGDFIGKTIASVRVELEGRDVADMDVRAIIATAPGEALSMLAVRETVTRLFALGRYEDIRVHADLGANGLSLVYDLVPVHPVDKFEFTGVTGGAGVDTGRLKRDLIDRYGASPPVGRAPELVRVIEDDLRAEGYLRPSVTPHSVLRHAPDRATLVFDLQPGDRTRIADIEIAGDPGLTRTQLLDLLDVGPGDAYRPDALASMVSRYVDNRRARGYLEARLTTSSKFDDDDRAAHLTIAADQGPHVRVVFRGDPLPADRRADLVPIEREGSADEDLLEDSTNRIEEYLHAQGYREARAPHTREQQGQELTLAFDVAKGPLYRVSRLEISGNATMPALAFADAVRLKEGLPFSEARLDADAAAVEAFYRRQGYAGVRVLADAEPAAHDAAAAEVPIVARIEIEENVRTMIQNVSIRAGGVDVPEDLLGTLGSQPGRPFFATQVAMDRDAIQQRFANLGYQNATVTSDPGLSADRTGANVTFTIVAGPRLIVDHVLIVGNVRTKAQTIERELQFKPGDPLGLAAVNETQRRLSALGLFRRVEITAIGQGESARDVLVRVDEAPVTTISYGGGVEANQRQVSESGGGAQARLEFAPRAFFEIGRRNLFGKNRSVNLFSRLSLRPKDAPIFSQQQQLEGTSGGFGFAEYRVLGTFREPRVFGTQADAFVTGTIEQQARSSFDFARRSIDVEAGRRLSRSLSVSSTYQIQRVRLFNEIITGTAEQLLIDRAFPQVRLSSFSSSIINSTRNDPLDPTDGSYLSVNGQVAARAIGSEIGFVKSYARAQWFRTIPGGHGTVLATNATLGLARALPRQVVQEDGTSQTVTEIPASERFFAGGDTTVRGFALDQLGVSDTSDHNTIDPNGFPIGGNGLVVLNAELRAPYHSLEFVTFFDTGNVFARPSDINLTELRSSVGFGFRYKSPVGPIRIDLGFKTHRHTIAGREESLTAIHISLGQAF
jgi:outer membrane protein insertion porin family